MLKTKTTLLILLIFNCCLNTFAQATNEVLDSTNSNMVKLEFYGFEPTDTVIIKLNGNIIIDTAFTSELLKTPLLLRLKQGVYVIAIESRHKDMIITAPFMVNNQNDFREDRNEKFCNVIWLGYIPIHRPVADYKENTIDREVKKNLKEWSKENNLNKKFSREDIETTYRQVLEYSFEEKHGKDLDFTGMDEYYQIDLNICEARSR